MSGAREYDDNVNEASPLQQTVQRLEVLLIRNDGACWSPVEFGDGLVTGERGYPRLSTAPARLVFTKVGDGPIADGDTIGILTTEPLPVSLEKQALGVWNSPALYYYKVEDNDKEEYVINRMAGPGPIAYGDEVYLTSVAWEQRVGRQEGKIYLTSNEDFTDTFTLVDPASPPLTTSFNPLDQIHRAGEQKSTTAHGWVWRKTDPAQEMLSVETSLPAGAFTALLQVAPGGDTGKHCVTISVQSGGFEIASKQVYTEDYPVNDWQRAFLPFTMASAGVVKIVVTAADNDETLWTGVVSINPAGKRPFYVIAHRCNTVDEAVKAVNAGANAIEFDITPELEGDNIVFKVHHTGGPTTPLNDYINGIIDQGVVDTVAMLVIDIKPDSSINSYSYGYELASQLSSLGITAARAFFSIEDPTMANDFYQGVAEVGMFSGARDASLIKELPNLETDPSIWYDVGVYSAGATFLGLGVDAKVIISTMADWLEPVSYTTVLRDRYQQLKKAYYWTLDSNDSMRKMLDLNVDGIIVNDSATLLAVLQEQPYAEMFRLATVYDSVNQVYGWSSLVEPYALPRPARHNPTALTTAPPTPNR